jgi:hypothetical protein
MTSVMPKYCRFNHVSEIMITVKRRNPVLNNSTLTDSKNLPVFALNP